MPDFANVTAMVLDPSPSGYSSDLLVVYGGQWYTMPYEPGGWRLRQQYVPNPGRSGVPGEPRRIMPRNAREYWDHVTSGIVDEG